MTLPATKLSFVRAAMAAGDWEQAIILAAKFQDLGAQRDAILSAREAYLRPAFQQQLRRDLAAMKAAGKAALIARFGDV